MLAHSLHCIIHWQYKYAGTLFTLYNTLTVQICCVRLKSGRLCILCNIRPRQNVYVMLAQTRKTMLFLLVLVQTRNKTVYGESNWNNNLFCVKLEHGTCPPKINTLYTHDYPAATCPSKINTLYTHGYPAAVRWLLNVPATCKCISGTDLLRKLYMLPHWDRSCRSNSFSNPVSVLWHHANLSLH